MLLLSSGGGGSSSWRGRRSMVVTEGCFFTIRPLKVKMLWECAKFALRDKNEISSYFKETLGSD